MKGTAEVISTLNALLADELTAISQYTVHAEVLENWHFGKLYEPVWKRALTEMKHAEKLIERIIFLEGLPIVSKLHPMHIGAEVPAQIKNDLDSEYGAVKGYNTGIALCVAQADNGSRALMESILHDEEDHVDWLEAQLDQIAQMGIQAYLAQQLS
jgi:bacterioferritin